MKITRKVIRLILHYVLGIALAYGFGVWCFWLLCYILFVRLRILHMHADPIAYIMYHSFFFVGIPLGGPLGMVFVDKFVFKSPGSYIWKIITGFIMGISGSAFVYWVLPLWDVEVFEGFLPSISGISIAGDTELFLLITVLFSLIGYHAAGLFRYGKKDPLVD